MTKDKLKIDQSFDPGCHSAQAGTFLSKQSSPSAGQPLLAWSGLGLCPCNSGELESQFVYL